MKTIISLLAVMAMTLFLGTAYAADWSNLNTSFESTDVPDAYKGFAESEIMGARGAAAGGTRVEGIAWDNSLNASFESTDVPDAYKGFAEPEIKVIRGAATGGLRGGDPDKGSRIHDSLFGNYESTDVLDTYRVLAK